MNRKQLIGKVDITRVGNPALTDQTNREGFCDSEEKTALVRCSSTCSKPSFAPS